MNDLPTLIQEYLAYCATQKRLDEKTLKAYCIDLRQFREQSSTNQIDSIDSTALEKYIAALHQRYLPKTVKRKLASVKAFFHYLEYRNLIDKNPFSKIQAHAILPDVIIPYYSYSLFFVLRILGEYFAGLYTIEQLCERYGISRNQLFKWVALFKAHKQEWLGLLADAEISDLSFPKNLADADSYSSFSMVFIRRSSHSFLQSHRNHCPMTKFQCTSCITIFLTVTKAPSLRAVMRIILYKNIKQYYLFLYHLHYIKLFLN